ncbi:cyclin-dependent kinase inhibitor 3 [Dorcoceras hygrometricum]|uniref:Cyclin-dependent kinase inhibitor 3 n=1 Tax=Dorcoceras hygrometricum TaxID=472368 RepID=A0A2Z7CHW5_9LAMI|nr:cyclin-dependent kinase inhibitor 3 [Dorcoceras hygrometricum]
MGKYMKKSKTPGEVGVVDASQSTGVRTRAKTLALRRLRSSEASTPSKGDLGYLELRSRRLVRRPPLLGKYMQSSGLVSFANDSSGFATGECGGFGSREGCSGSGYGLKSGSVGPGKGEDACLVRKMKSSRGVGSGDLGIDVSFGENNSESEDWNRHTYTFFELLQSDKENTPCSCIKVADSSTIPGSTMKQTSFAPATNQRAHSALSVDMPTTDEIEEFFAREEQLWQHLFTEKYNFDVVNDLPLPGRYEWVKKSP